MAMQPQPQPQPLPTQPDMAWQADGLDATADSADDERALVAAAQRDPAAFGVLYRRHLPSVYRYLRSRSVSDDEAADLTQQVFLKALEALPGYRERGLPFAAWLMRIARNASIDAARARRPSVPWQLVPEVEDTQDGAAGPGQFVELLAPLDESKRELLLLRFVVGLNCREIAAVVGMREAAVRKQLSRSLQALKERYRAEID
jgi:RNA polymerase sigma-70 factor (ECF subfamily)